MGRSTSTCRMRGGMGMDKGRDDQLEMESRNWDSWGVDKRGCLNASSCHHEARCRAPTRSSYQARTVWLFVAPAKETESKQLVEQVVEQLASLSAPRPAHDRSILGLGGAEPLTLAPTSRQSPPDARRATAGPDLSIWIGSPTVRIHGIMDHGTRSRKLGPGSRRDGLFHRRLDPEGVSGL
jgi:hypothetical protein